MAKKQHGAQATLEEYLRFIADFAGEFTIGALKRPLGEVRDYFAQGNQTIDAAPPATAPEHFVVSPAIVLTQANGSDWTLVQYSLGQFLPRATEHLAYVAGQMSADALLHAAENTSGVEEIQLWQAGAPAGKRRDSASQDIVDDLRESAAEFGAELPPYECGSTTVGDFGEVYDQLGVDPIAAALGADGKFYLAPGVGNRLASAAYFDLNGFHWHGQVDVPAEWAEAIDLATFEQRRLHFGYAATDTLVLEKTRETIDGRDVTQTAYFYASDDGLQKVDKRAASALITERAVARMQQEQAMIVNTSVKKAYKNGAVDLNFTPTRHDQFILKLTKELVGGDVQEFLDSLSAARATVRFGSVELAKSGRSKCRACGQKIEKGELRIGEHHDANYEYAPVGWRHARCVAFDDPARLHNFDQLASEHQHQLRVVMGK